MSEERPTLYSRAFLCQDSRCRQKLDLVSVVVSDRILFYFQCPACKSIYWM
jgi:hypothetical protein